MYDLKRKRERESCDLSVSLKLGGFLTSCIIVLFIIFEEILCFLSKI